MDSDGFYKKRSYYFVLLVLLSLPSLFLGYIRYVLPFIWWAMDDVVIIEKYGSLINASVSNSGLYNYPLIIYALHIIPSIPLSLIIYLPLMFWIVPVCYYVLARRVMGSIKLALLITAYICFDFTVFPCEYNIQAYTWTHALFLCVLILYNLYLGKNRWNYLLLINLCFISVYFFHPTYAMWIISFFAIANFIIYFSRANNFLKNTKLNINQTMSFIVIYLIFNKILYSNFLVKFVQFDPGTIRDEYIYTIMSFLGLAISSSMEKYSMALPPASSLMGPSMFLRTLIIVISFIIIMFLLFRRCQLDKELLLIYSLSAVGIIHTLGYAIYGHMSLRVVVFLFPFIIILGMKKLGCSHRNIVLFLSSLVLLGIIQTGSFMLENYDERATIINDVLPSSTWLLDFIIPSSRILTDFDTSQVIYFNFVSQNSTFERIYFTSKFYDMIVNSTAEIKGIDYFIINKVIMSSPTYSISWDYYEPIALYFPYIQNNNNLNEIFDDGLILVLSNNTENKHIMSSSIF
jgi:hypothetical protein